MRAYLRRSIASLNQNKLRGLLAEIELRNCLHRLGFEDRVSPGGWIARSEGARTFGQSTVVLFPETIEPGQTYEVGRALSQPSHGLHAICATFHQSGIDAYFCAGAIGVADDPNSLSWQVVQLGLPMEQPYQPYPASIVGFRPRQRRHNFLRYDTETGQIPDAAVPAEFSKEHLRITLQDQVLSEISDIDGIFYGNQVAYPLEIKEKTIASDNRVGDYFGLDLGPFVKLAFYAAKRGNLHSIFIVREINNVEDRRLVAWWFIPFDKLAQCASWNPRAGGRNMMGGGSTVVPIPKSEFLPLDATTLALL